jgi:methionine sulfoxide reductase heme-binding subunit
MARLRITKLNLLAHIAAPIPLLVLLWDYYNNNLTINWIQGAEQRTGKIAIAFLALSLACTPVNTIFGWRQVIRLRRPLGVYAFFYALLHFSIFAVIDYGLDWSLLPDALFEKPYIIVGLSALLILIPLALTSWRWWMKRMGKAWQRLHSLVYAAGCLVVLHYAWAVKGDLLRLQGNISGPLFYTLAVGFLLMMRVPTLRRWAVRLRTQSVGQLSRKITNRPSEKTPL